MMAGIVRLLGDAKKEAEGLRDATGQIVRNQEKAARIGGSGGGGGSGIGGGLSGGLIGGSGGSGGSGFGSGLPDGGPRTGISREEWEVLMETVRNIREERRSPSPMGRSLARSGST